MTQSRKLNDFIRPDWLRDNIAYQGDSNYEVLDSSGSFLTRQGLPKGNYVLRLNLDTGSGITMATVAVEPVGTNKDNNRILQLLVEPSQPCISLPLLLTHRSRIRLNPGVDKGLLKAVNFSLADITEKLPATIASVGSCQTEA